MAIEATAERVSAAEMLRVFARVVVVAPHPDDDVLGCGGLLAAAAASGCDVQAVYLTDGSASHVGSPTFPPARLSAIREDEARAALRELGVATEPHFFRLPDGTLDGSAQHVRDDLAHRLADIFGHSVFTTETLVLGPWRRDPHPDHRAAALLVRAARALAAPASAASVTLLEYRVWLDERGEVADQPHAVDGRTYAVDVAPFVPRKQAALAQHRSQLGKLIHDAAWGFALPPGMIARAGEDWEYFTRAD